MPSWKKVVLHGSSGSLAHLKLENLTSQNVLGTDANGNVIAGSVSGYSLPTASTSTLGGIKVGNTLNISSGVLDAKTYQGAVATVLGEVPGSAGTAGIVPAASPAQASYFLKGDGTWAVPTNTVTRLRGSLSAGFIAGDFLITGSGATTVGYSNGVFTISSTDHDTTYSLFSGASASVNGAAGLVPGPRTGDQIKFLKGDGTWAVTPDTTYSNATTSAAGLMSATDKTKLNGIASGANAYSLPAASTETLGGIKVGSGLSITEQGVLSAAAGTAIGAESDAYYSGNLLLTGGGATTVTYKSATNEFTISSTDTNTTYTAGTGLTLSGTEFSLASHSHAISDITGLSTALDGKLSTTGTAASATVVATLRDSAPSGTTGQLWWETDTGILKIYSGSVWVDATPIPDPELYFRKAGGAITGDVSISQALTVTGNITVGGTVDGRDVATDGTKLDGIASGANNYSLPIASSERLGGIKVGTNLTIAEDGTLRSTDTNTTYTAGTGLTLSGTEFSVTANTYAAAGHNHDSVYLKIADTGSIIDYIVASAPGTLDTLNEIAAAIGDDANFSASIASIIANKADASHTHSDASTERAGFMSATDKTKLDGIAASANNYSLPIAAADTLGGVKVGTNLSIDVNGVLNSSYVNTVTSVGVTGDLTSGNITLVGSGATTITKSAGTITISSTDTDTTYSNASTERAGLMSTTDKTKLDGIAASANNYSLPIASASTLGGIKVGTNLSIDDNGILSSTDTLSSVTGRGGSTASTLYFTGGTSTTPALHIRSGGSNWSEGLAIHPSSDSGYALSFFRTKASYTDQTNTWAIGNFGDTNALNHFGLLRKGLTGGVADRAADAVFTVNPNGTFKFGFNPYVGSNVILHAGNISSYANNYSLPIASSERLGGVKSGTDISIDANGNVSVVNDSHTHDDRYYTETEVNTLLAGKLGSTAKAADSDLLDGYDSGYFYPNNTPNGYSTGDINGQTTHQRLWGTDSVQDLLQFNPPTEVEYSTDGGNTWTTTTISSNVFSGKIYGAWSGWTIAAGQAAGGWTHARLTWRNFGYRFFSHFTIGHSTNGHSFNFVFYKSDLEGNFTTEAYRQNGISSWPGYTFSKHVNVSGWWDTRDIRMVFEVNRGADDYTNYGITIGHIGMKGSYGSFTRLYDWDGDRNVTFASNISVGGSITVGGTVDGRDIATDGTKLDGIAANANNYSLPIASASTLGGIKVGTNLSIDVNGVLSSTDTNTVTSVGVTGDLTSGNITLVGSGATTITKSAGTITITSTDTDTTYSNATVERAGLMSTTDKTKLDGIAASANNYSLPTASSTVLGGVKIGYTASGKNYPVQLSNEQMYVNVPWTDTDTTYSDATTERAGLMSTTDKTKLDGIAASANNYSLPLASASTLGGIKVGTNLSIDVNGVLSSTDTDTRYSAGTGLSLSGTTFSLDSHSHAISDVTGLQTALDGKLSTTGTAASATVVATLQDTAPTGTAGKLWWETDTGILKIYYGSAWVDAVPMPDTALFYSKAGGTITGDVSINQTLTVGGNTTIGGNIAVTGTVDGRDIATDGAKLDGIAAGATNVTNNNQLTNGAGYITSYVNTVTSVGVTGDVSTGNVILAGAGATSITKSGGTITITSTDTDTTYSNATVERAGLMSTTDKTKLDGIAASANNYSLPTASATVLGGIKVGTNLSIDVNGVLSSTDTNTNTVTSVGISGDLSTGNITLAGGGATTISKSGGTITITSTDTDTTYSNATVERAGLMSTTDKSKLDGIAAGATNVTNNNQLTNGAGYITSYVNTTYSAGTNLSLSGTTFNVSSTPSFTSISTTHSSIGRTYSWYGGNLASTSTSTGTYFRIMRVYYNQGHWGGYGTTRIKLYANQYKGGYQEWVLKNYTGGVYLQLNDYGISPTQSGTMMTLGDAVRVGTYSGLDTFYRDVYVWTNAYIHTTYQLEVDGNYGIDADGSTNDYTKFVIWTGANRTTGNGGFPETPSTTYHSVNYAASAGGVAWANISDKPTIPTNNNQLTNGAGYITSYVDTITSVGVTGDLTSGNITLVGTGATSITKSGGTITITSTDTDTTYSDATTERAGLMSTTDKTKLDGIAASANNYSLPKASATVLGGIKIGTNLSIDTNGVVSSTDTNTWRPLGTGATDAAAGNHTHDDRYYTESEVDTLLTGKQASGTYLTALPAHTHTLSELSDRPGWFSPATNMTADLANFNNSVPSGFYQYSGATNAPGSGWYNLINVRHSNRANDHGFQIAASYYDENIWTRTYQGGTGNNDGTFTTWRSLVHSGNIGSQSVNYAASAGSATTAGTVTGKSSIGKTAHTAGADDYHLELYSSDTGDSSKEVSIRFHQASRYYAQLRYRSGGFRFTGGADDNLTSVYASTFYGDLSGNATTATTAGTANAVSWTNVSDKPTIPTNNNQLTNGAGYITSYVNTVTRVGVADDVSSGDIVIRGAGATTVTKNAGTITITSTDTDTNTWRPLGTGATDAAAGNHTHDDRYYTESEVDTLLAGKLGTSDTAASATTVVTLQDSAPSGTAGKLWWETDTGKLKVYYGSAWIDATPIPDMSIYYTRAGGAITGDVTIQQTLTVVGNTLIEGTLTETSDISLKENITPLQDSLNKVLQLKGVSFNKKTTPDVKEIGFIAQEVEEILPELVSETEEGIKTVSYSRVTAVLVETIKQQQSQIDELKELVNKLTEKINTL